MPKATKHRLRPAADGTHTFKDGELPTPYSLTREQARKILTEAGHDPDVHPETLPGPEATGTDRVLRHYWKWLRDDGSTTVIPLTADELPKGHRLSRADAKE
jgi:hypothetical protein